MAHLHTYGYDFTGKTVLVVEDNRMAYMLVSAMLKEVKVDLIHADDGNKAVEFCKSNPDLDLVLMDMHLPGINGLQATREIKKIRPGLPVIAATASIYDEDKEACIKAGCDAFISKPLHYRKMLELMQSFFDRQDL